MDLNDELFKYENPWPAIRFRSRAQPDSQKVCEMLAIDDSEWFLVDKASVGIFMQKERFLVIVLNEL